MREKSIEESTEEKVALNGKLFEINACSAKKSAERHFDRERN